MRGDDVPLRFEHNAAGFGCVGLTGALRSSNARRNSRFLRLAQSLDVSGGFEGAPREPGGGASQNEAQNPREFRATRGIARDGIRNAERLHLIAQRGLSPRASPEPGWIGRKRFLRNGFTTHETEFLKSISITRPMETGALLGIGRRFSGDIRTRPLIIARKQCCLLRDYSAGRPGLSRGIEANLPNWVLDPELVVAEMPIRYARKAAMCH